MTEIVDSKSHIIGLSVKNGPAGVQQHEVGLISRDRLVVPIKSAKDQRLVTYEIDSDDDSVEILNTSTLLIHNIKERQNERAPTINLEVDCDIKDLTSCGSSPNVEDSKPAEKVEEEKLKSQENEEENLENDRLKRLLLNEEDGENDEDYEEDSTPDLQLIRPGSSKYSANRRRKFCPSADNITCCKLQ